MLRKGSQDFSSVPADKRELFEALFVLKKPLKGNAGNNPGFSTLARRTSDWKLTVHKERDYPIVRFNGKTWEEYRSGHNPDGSKWGVWLPAREFPFG